MCVKLSFGDLNIDPYPQHRISIYICEVTTILRVHGGKKSLFIKSLKPSPNTNVHLLYFEIHKLHITTLI